jgi:hypothetical protein
MRRWFLLLALAALLALPGSAGATIVLQKGMAGITLSMSKAKVRSVLGKPTSSKTGKNEFGPYTKYVYPGLTIIFQGNDAVTSVETAARKERTVNGIGVGSTMAEVKAKVPGVKCDLIGPIGDCHVGAFKPGKRVTDFVVNAKHVVTRVVVGFVID